MPNRLIALKWSTWLYALAWAVLGGTATTLVSAFTITDLTAYNAWTNLAKLAGAAAVVNLLLYLKQSPLPPKDVEEDLEPYIPPQPVVRPRIVTLENYNKPKS